MNRKSLHKLFGLLLAVIVMGNSFLVGFPTFAVNEKGEVSELSGQEAEQSDDGERQEAVSQNSSETADESASEDSADTAGASEDTEIGDADEAEKESVESSDASEEPGEDVAIENVRELIAALPEPDTVKAQSQEEREDSYRQLQEAYEAFEALTEEQKAEIDEAEETFASLFAYFDSLTAPADGEVEWVEPDLSDYIFQEGGFSVLDEPTPMALSSDDEAQAYASDLEEVKTALVTGMRDWKESIDISGYGVLLDQMDALYTDVVNYNPDLFYVASFIHSYNPDTNTVISVKPKYDTAYSKADVEKYNAALDAAFAEALPNQSGMSDLQKAMALHDYLAQHMYYNYLSDGETPGDKHNAYNALVEGTAVCQGYTLAYSDLLKKAGISFDFATSDAMNHMWSYVLIGGNWYHVDVTWDDPSADKVGRVSHRYFLNSDSFIGNEGEDGHYGWVSKQTCNSTQYDDAYWQNALSAIFHMNGGDYYLKGDRSGETVTINLVRREGSAEDVVYTLETNSWPASGGGYWQGVFSSLSRYKDRLYFNDSTKVYRISSAGNSAADIYTYNDTDGLLYGSLVCKENITLGVAESPNEAGTTKVVPLPDEAIKSVSITASPSEAVYGYASSSAPVLTAETVKGEGASGDVSYQWYKVNNGAETAIDGAAGVSYTVETGLDAGTYTYRVKAELEDSSQSADTEVTVTQAPLTVTARPQTIVYGGAIENTADQATAEGLVSGHRLSGVTLTTSDKNVTANGTITPGTAAVADASGKNVTANYAITYKDGKLTITRRPVTVTADDKSKTYGETDPLLTYAVAPATPLISGESLKGTLTRRSGENAGSYDIEQGTLTNGQNPNYAITFIKGTFTIQKADYKANEPQAVLDSARRQTVVAGIGAFAQPSFTGAGSEAVSGTLTYAYGNASGMTYDQTVNMLKELTADTEGSLSYTFTPEESGNYEGEKTGTISFIVKDVSFSAGGSAAGVGNGVTVKESPVYGDNWDEIVRIGNITAQAGNATDPSPRYTLSVSGKPDAGNQTFRVLYSGTINGKAYTDVTVCEGTVEVGQKRVTASAGTCKVSKVYDGTVSAGTVSGALAVTGLLSGDSGVIVAAAPAAYESPDVGGQSTVNVALTLRGNGSENYRLASGTLTVPCEITPKDITPTVEITGSYQYTGEAVLPTVTVKDGETLLRERDYELLLSDNINAGSARVEIRAKEGGNYTWADPVVQTFPVEKAPYTKEASAALSVRYGGSGTYDLASILPEGAKLGSPAVSDGGDVLTEAPGLDGTLLFYSAVNSQANAGKTAEIIIPVTESTNYLPFEVIVTLTVTDKLPQTEFRFDTAVQNKSYGSEDFTFAAAGAVAGSSVTYASSDVKTATVDNDGKVHILKPGTVVITATAAETGDYHEGIATYTLNIAPAALTWDTGDLSAADRQENVDKDSRTATLFGSLKVSGILEGDAAEVQFICTADQLKGVYMKADPGVQKVALSWNDGENPVLLQGAKASYYTLPAALPEISGIITEVTDLPAVPPELEKDEYKLTSENGISEVPEALEKIEELNTPEKIVKRMKDVMLQIAQNSISSENVAVYDVTLMVKTGDGRWEAVSPEDFPESGITVTLPYPDGTGKDTHTFTVVHMITAGTGAGKTESLAVTNTANGIQFKVFSLSPIAIGWKEVKKDTPADTNRPNTGTDQNGNNKGSGSGQNSTGSGTKTENGNSSGNNGTSGNQNGSNVGTNTGAVSGQNATSANTGDQSPIAFYMLLLLTTGGILLSYGIRRRKNSQV